MYIVQIHILQFMILINSKRYRSIFQYLNLRYSKGLWKDDGSGNNKIKRNIDKK